MVAAAKTANQQRRDETVKLQRVVAPQDIWGTG